jgi:hypothetical protein
MRHHVWGQESGQFLFNKGIPFISFYRLEEKDLTGWSQDETD